MRPAVLPGFLTLTAAFEGGQQTNFMYCDVLGYVTTAFGLLINSAAAALSLPWRRTDGSLASHSEIVAAWATVKARQDLKLRGGMAYRGVTTLRLDEEGVREAVRAKLETADHAMRARFPTYVAWPCDAQLAVLSMCWAVGGAWPTKFPKMAAACAVGGFLLAAVECTIDDTGNPGITPRNKANVVLLRNASVVVDRVLDYDTLWYPRDLWETPLGPDDDTVIEEVTPVRAVAFPIVSRLPDTNPFDEPANDDGDDPEAA